MNPPLNEDDLKGRLEALLPELLEKGEFVRLAAGSPQLLGELLRDAGRIDDECVRETLEKQAATGQRFGDLLISQGRLTIQERDVALEFQRLQRDREHASPALRIGEILVACGRLSREQLDLALARHLITGRKLGEELVACGEIDEPTLEKALSLQRKLVGVGLALSLLMTAAPAAAAPEIGTKATGGGVGFAIRIPVQVKMSLLSQARSVTVTTLDIANGFVRVPSASRFEMRANAPYTLRFGGNGEWFRSVQVTGLPRAVELDASGGEYVESTRSFTAVERDLSFQFALSPDAKPGDYPWPLSLTATTASS